VEPGGHPISAARERIAGAPEYAVASAHERIANAPEYAVGPMNRRRQASLEPVAATAFTRVSAGRNDKNGDGSRSRK
jgi:hypothetical protein